MCTLSLIESSGNIHPRAKQPVGLRLSLAVQNLAYGRPVQFAAPTFVSAKVSDNDVTLTFDGPLVIRPPIQTCPVPTTR